MTNSILEKTVIFGANGQVGRALLSLLGPRGKGLSHQEADFENPSTLLAILDQQNPSAVINAAAYTAVDLAEKNEALAMKINGEAPSIIARWCAKKQVPFIHYSTDYVFSGEGEKPWKEEDAVSPLNAYGRTKLEGERQIQAVGGSYLIFRTSWVYDAHGKNFLNTMLRLGKERETIQVVSDQWGAPTYAPHLAKATFKALEKATSLPQFPNGIYHLCGDGETNWHAFATRIFDLARQKGIPLQVKTVSAIPSSAFPTPAKRPHNSRLNLDQAERILGVRLPHWEVGLEECMEIWK